MQNVGRRKRAGVALVFELDWSCVSTYQRRHHHHHNDSDNDGFPPVDGLYVRACLRAYPYFPWPMQADVINNSSNNININSLYDVFIDFPYNIFFFFYYFFISSQKCRIVLLRQRLAILEHAQAHGIAMTSTNDETMTN